MDARVLLTGKQLCPLSLAEIKGLLRIHQGVTRLYDAPNSVNAAIQRVVKAQIAINWALVAKGVGEVDETIKLEPVDVYIKDLVGKGRLTLPLEDEPTFEKRSEVPSNTDQDTSIAPESPNGARDVAHVDSTADSAEKAGGIQASEIDNDVQVDPSVLLLLRYYNNGTLVNAEIAEGVQFTSQLIHGMPHVPIVDVLSKWTESRYNVSGAISVSFGCTGTLSGIKQPLTHRKTVSGVFEHTTTDALPVGWEDKANAHVVMLIIEDLVKVSIEDNECGNLIRDSPSPSRSRGGSVDGRNDSEWKMVSDMDGKMDEAGGSGGDVEMSKAQSSKGQIVKHNFRVVLKNNTLVEWLRDQYAGDEIVLTTRSGQVKEAEPICKLCDQILKVAEVVEVHKGKTPEPASSIVSDHRYKKITMENIAALFKRRSNWVRQCVQAAKLMETKGEANEQIITYLTTDDQTTFGVASFLTYLNSL